MSASDLRSPRWRDLDLAQMPFWANAPRRWTLALLAFFVLLLCSLFLIVPQLKQLDSEREQSLKLQQQIKQVYEVSPQVLTNIPSARQIRLDEESAWLAQLANVARQNQLDHVKISAHNLSETERAQLREHIQNTIKGSSHLVNKEGVDLPLDWLDQVAWVDISVQGTYAQILGFAGALGERDEWLAVGQVRLAAVNDTQVSWQAGFWYYKEAEQKGAGRDAATQ